MAPDPVISPPHVAKPLRLEPFTGLMLSPSRVADPASARAFARPYRAVAQRLREWERRGHVRRDDAGPALYLHEYTSNGLTVRGLVGAMELSRMATDPQHRAVWPHEGIHPTQVEELAARMAQMRVNPAPILMVHHGPASVRDVLDEVAAGPPLREYDDRAQQRQRIWAVRDPDLQVRIAEGLAGTEALLADGHHRYAAYLTLQHQHPGTGWDRGLAMLVDQQDTPLFLGAIHRVLRRTGLADVLQAAHRTGCPVTETTSQDAVDRLGPNTLVLTDGDSWATVATPPDRLAVTTLHAQLVPELSGPPVVTYHHAVGDALQHLREGDVAVLLPAMSLDDLQQSLASGHLLPEKATSFQPKPSVGAIMRSLNDE